MHRVPTLSPTSDGRPVRHRAQIHVTFRVDNVGMPALTYVDRSHIREGRLSDLEQSLDQLVRHVRAHARRVLVYGVYFSPDRTQMTVVHVHPDSESLEALMASIAPLLPPFRDFLELRSIDVYGAAGEVVRGQLEAKARLLGGTVTFHDAVDTVELGGA